MSFIAESSAEVTRLSATIERAPVGIGHFDQTGKFLFVNPQLCHIFGLSREALLGKTFQDISFPEELPRCLSLTQQLAAGTIPKYAVEKRFQRPNGSFVYARVIVTAVRDSENRVQFFLGVVEDLSDQWAIEQARRAAEDRLQLALEASCTGIYRYDFRTESLDFANNLNKVFGFAADEPLQSLERLLSAIHPDDRPRVLRSYERSATQGADFDEDFRVVRPDGTVRWISDKAKMTLDEAGNPHYLTGACIDVTRLRDVELQREALLSAERAARADAERSAHMRDEVLAIVAHDLRNPVHTIVVGTAVLAALPASADEDRRKQADVIRRNALGMDHLIRDLLDVTRIQLGQLSIHTAEVAVDALIGETVANCAQQAQQAGLRLEAHVATGLPAVVADPDRISQVLGNLLGNAFKFTPRGGRVTVAARRTDAWVEIAVSDTGCGIAATDLPRVFDRFWQARRDSGHSAGLGLAIVRGIIDAHGGRIDADSIEGQGATFRFQLRAAV